MHCHAFFCTYNNINIIFNVLKAKELNVTLLLVRGIDDISWTSTGNIDKSPDKSHAKAIHFYLLKKFAKNTERRFCFCCIIHAKVKISFQLRTYWLTHVRRYWYLSPHHSNKKCHAIVYKVSNYTSNVATVCNPLHYQYNRKLVHQ